VMVEQRQGIAEGQRTAVCFCGRLVWVSVDSSSSSSGHDKDENSNDGGRIGRLGDGTEGPPNENQRSTNGRGCGIGRVHWEERGLERFRCQ
jgi:hypothetical protein